MKRILSVLILLAALVLAGVLGYRYLGPVLAEKLAGTSGQSESGQPASRPQSEPSSQSEPASQSEAPALSSLLPLLPEELQQKASRMLEGISAEDQDRAFEILSENVSVSDLSGLLENFQNGDTQALKDYALSHFSEEELAELKSLYEKNS